MVSLYFVGQGEVCPGSRLAARQQRVPGPSSLRNTSSGKQACPSYTSLLDAAPSVCSSVSECRCSSVRLGVLTFLISITKSPEQRRGLSRGSWLNPLNTVSCVPGANPYMVWPRRDACPSRSPSRMSSWPVWRSSLSPASTGSSACRGSLAAS